MKVTIAGYGAGQSCLPETQRVLDKAGLVLGAPRLLKNAAVAPPRGVAAVNPEEIAGAIDTSNAESACVLMSGDSGFYSGTKRLLPLLSRHDVTVLPGISSVQALSAAIKTPWQDWRFCSAHGVDCNAAHEVSRHAACFFLTGGGRTPDALCRALTECGFGALQAVVGSDLGGIQHQIVEETVEELARRTFSPLSVLLVQNPAPKTRAGFGLPDVAFVRGDVPMTKSEVRAVALSKLQLHSGDVVYDIGAGTGSVAVEAALSLDTGRVYAVEQKSEGYHLIAENAGRLGAFNLICVKGIAPGALQSLPVPDAAFIGGSGGELRGIVALLLKKNPCVRIVIAAVTLETLSEAVGLLKEYNISNAEVVQVAVSRAEPLGNYHMMRAQNPVYIISGGGEDA